MVFLLGLCAVVSSSIHFVRGVVLPPPTGPYNVGSKPYVLNHTTLNDPVSPTNITTSILLNVYYPTRDPAPSQKYVWDSLSTYYDGYYGIPNGTFSNITGNIAFDAKPLLDDECANLHLPTLLWGPPAAGPPSQMFLGMISELVSKGYVVVTVDHPYEPPYLQYPNGTGYRGHEVDWEPPDDTLVALHEYRITDNSATLDALPQLAEDTGVPLNLTHIAFFGHSFGGSAALAQINAERNRTSSKDKTFLGAMNLDGTVFGPGAQNSSVVDMHAPALLMASEGHLRSQDPSWPIFESWQSGWTKEVRVLGKSNHTDYSDLIFLKQANGIAGGDGAIAASRFLEVERMFVTAFFDMLIGGGEGVLAGNEDVLEEYPEVAFEYNNTGDPCAPDLCWATES